MDDHEKDVNDGSYDGQDEEVEEDLSQTHQVPNDALAQTSNSIEYRWVEEISSHPVGGTGPSPGGLALATLKREYEIVRSRLFRLHRRSSTNVSIHPQNSLIPGENQSP